MNPMINRIHEPEAELLSADDVLEDYLRLRAVYPKSEREEHSVSLSMPLWVMLEAIDQLEPSALYKIAQHVAERLALEKTTDIGGRSRLK